MKNLFCLPIFLPVLLFSFTSSAQSGQKVFEMKYEVVKATAVCWEACRFDCEESNAQVFFDTKTFKLLAGLKNEGKIWRSSSLKCDDDITFVSEHMPSLQKKDPKAANKIMAEKGTEVDLLIYTDIRSQAASFIDQLLDDLSKK